MTDFPTKRAGWQKRQQATRWRSMLAIFITILLFFAIFNGLLKVSRLKGYIDHASWDGQSSFVAVLSTRPAALIIYQKDPKRLVFAKFDENTYFATGRADEPLVSVATLIRQKDGEKLTAVLSNAFRTDIKSYIFFKNEMKAENSDLSKLFGKFASPLTPMVILAKGTGGNIERTNVTRSDLVRLWWQVKSISVNKLIFEDYTGAGENVVNKDGQKVKVFDSDVIHRSLAKYLENSKVVGEATNVEIENASGVAGAGKLAGDFAESAGFRVVKVETAPSQSAQSHIEGQKSSYSAKYLASMFNCAIFPMPHGENQNIRVILGEDFSKKYF